MLPTFCGISLIVFLVLNLAPGRPGAQQQSTDLASDLRGQSTQESFQIFREQFSLDKPILFNSRFALEPAELEHLLKVSARLIPATAAEQIAAREALEDFGEYGIPHLVELIGQADKTVRDNSGNEASPAASDSAEVAAARHIRDLGVYFLKLNARRPLVDPFNSAPSDELRAKNQRIDSENAEIREMSYALDAPEAEKRAILDKWQAWYGERRQRYEYSSLDKVRVFFLDTRFARYWRNLVKLDFGVSLVSREPVMDTLLSKLKYSLSLSVVSLLLAYLVSIPLGIFSAVKKDTPGDRALTVGLFMLYSLPSFFVATLLLIYLSVGSDIAWLRWFPTGGWQSQDFDQLTTWGKLKDVAWHLVLPLFCLTYGSLAALSRYMRTGLLEVIRSDYVRTARAKGLPESEVIGRHALRNGLLPILTLLGGLLPAVLGGSVIVEYIFGIPGMGLWVIEAIYQRDYNVIMAVQLSSTILVLVGLLLTDLSYALVDPRIRYQ
jgi:peptide/nickel transport system permease protein